MNTRTHLTLKAILVFMLTAGLLLMTISVARAGELWCDDKYSNASYRIIGQTSVANQFVEVIVDGQSIGSHQINSAGNLRVPLGNANNTLEVEIKFQGKITHVGWITCDSPRSESSPNRCPGSTPCRLPSTPAEQSVFAQTAG